MHKMEYALLCNFGEKHKVGDTSPIPPSIKVGDTSPIPPSIKVGDTSPHTPLK